MSEKYINVKKRLTALFKKHGYKSPTITKGAVESINAPGGTITVRPNQVEDADHHSRKLFVDYLMAQSKRGPEYLNVVTNTFMGLL